MHFSLSKPPPEYSEQMSPNMMGKDPSIHLYINSWIRRCSANICHWEYFFSEQVWNGCV